MALDAGDWIAICCATGGGGLALMAWGTIATGPPALWFVGGLVSGAILATGFLAWWR